MGARTRPARRRSQRRGFLVPAPAAPALLALLALFLAGDPGCFASRNGTSGTGPQQDGASSVVGRVAAFERELNADVSATSGPSAPAAPGDAVPESPRSPPASLGPSWPPPSASLAEATTTTPAGSRAAALRPTSSERPNFGEQNQEETFASITSEDAAWDFLRANVAFPGEEVCGAWATAYSKLHKSIRNSSSSSGSGGGSGPPRRYMTFNGLGGLGDRLLGLVSTFAASVLTSRALIITDSLIPRAFSPAEIDWRPGADVPKPVKGKSIEVTLGGDQARFQFLRAMKNRGKEKKYVFPTFVLINIGIDRRGRSRTKFPKNPIRYFREFERSSNIVVRSNGGSLTQLLRAQGQSGDTLRAMGLTISTAYPCVLRFLLRPVPRVLKPLVPLVLKLQPRLHRPSVCLQQRGDDKGTWDMKTGKVLLKGPSRNDKRQLRLLVDCATKVVGDLGLDRDQLQFIFISESVPVRKLAAQWLQPHTVLMSSIVPRHVAGPGQKTHEERTSATVDAASDWLLFSLCQYYIIHKSGFSKTAMAYSVSRKALFTHPRFGYGFGGCDGRRPDNLTAVGKMWSGL